MLPYRLQGVTLMHIQVFILCAERLNFTRAAAELHITPGMVSKKIAALESALELPLFIREKNRVTLTPEGQKLLSAWGPMAKAFLREAEELRSKDTEDTTIRVGLGDVTNLDRYFIPLSSAFSAEEWEQLGRAMEEIKKFSELYCTGCRYCQPCTVGIDIPRIFEMYTYYNVYGLKDHAKNMWRDYVRHGGKTFDDCLGCGACEEKCPQHLEIIKNLEMVCGLLKD